MEQVENTRRNIKLLEANKLSRSQHFFSPTIRSDLTQKVKSLYYQYVNGWTEINAEGLPIKIRGVKDKMIVLREIHTDEVMAIPYLTRFSPDYVTSQLIKMRKWFKYQTESLHRNRAKFLTLTLNPYLFTSVRDGYAKGQKKINTFLTRLRTINPGLGYIMVKEIQEESTKNIHWHLMLTGVEWIPDSMLNDYWGIGYWNLKEVKNSYGKTNNGLFRYMKKYLEKTLKNQNPNIVSDTLLWIWAMMIRSFSFSRIPKTVEISDTVELDLSKNNSNYLEEVWEYLGTYPKDLPWSDIENYDDLMYYLRGG
jgi:hypothetical protein